MKPLLAFAALCLFSPTNLLAQQSFSLTPNPVFGVEMLPIEVEGHATVKNLAATTDTFRWKRTIIRLDHDSVCQTAVTDPFLHWFYQVSEKTFWLAPGEEGPLNVTLWDFEETGCCAIVHMKLKKVDSPTDSIEAYYYLRTCQPLAVLEIQKSSVKIFPNPVAQFFSLKNADIVAQLTFCDASGRMLRRIPANPDNRYQVADLPSGAYYLVLENIDGSIVQVVEFVKM